MKVKEFYRPKTVEDALSMLDKKEAARVIAGGTDLIIAIRERFALPNALVDVSGITELQGIREEGDALLIGAGTTFSELLHSDLVKTYCNSLHEAASVMGAVQVRNRATIGGNVATSTTTADSVPPLLSLNATALVRSPRGSRNVSVADIVVGAGKNSLAADELITTFRIEKRPGAVSLFEKVGRRKALAVSTINLAVCAQLDAGNIKYISLALGAVGESSYTGEVAFRVAELEQFLTGKALNNDVIAEAAGKIESIAAAKLAGFPSAPYKQKIAATVLQRALKRILGGEGR